MNRNLVATVLWGLLILVLGIAALLYNFGVFAAYESIILYVVAGALALTGIGFLVMLALKRERWVFAIPGIILLSLGGVMVLTTVPAMRAEWLAAIFLGGVAISFLVLFLSNRRERWWALLQACTIGVIALVGLGVRALPDAITGAALFGGFALSFLALYLFSGDRSSFSWALALTFALGAFAFVLWTANAGAATSIVRLWPLLPIIVGVVLMARPLMGGMRTQPAAPVVPIEEVERPSEPLPIGAAEPARIQRPDYAGERPVPVAPPAPTAAPTPLPVADLPEALTTVDPNNPAAALDALLEASKTGGQ